LSRKYGKARSIISHLQEPIQVTWTEKSTMAAGNKIIWTTININIGYHFPTKGHRISEEIWMEKDPQITRIKSIKRGSQFIIYNHRKSKSFGRPVMQVKYRSSRLRKRAVLIGLASPGGSGFYLRRNDRRQRALRTSQNRNLVALGRFRSCAPAIDASVAAWWEAANYARWLRPSASLALSRFTGKFSSSANAASFHAPRFDSDQRIETALAETSLPRLNFFRFQPLDYWEKLTCWPERPVSPRRWWPASPSWPCRSWWCRWSCYGCGALPSEWNPSGWWLRPNSFR